MQSLWKYFIYLFAVTFSVRKYLLRINKNKRCLRASKLIGRDDLIQTKFDSIDGLLDPEGFCACNSLVFSKASSLIIIIIRHPWHRILSFVFSRALTSCVWKQSVWCAWVNVRPGEVIWVFLSQVYFYIPAPRCYNIHALQAIIFHTHTYSRLSDNQTAIFSNIAAGRWKVHTPPCTDDDITERCNFSAGKCETGQSTLVWLYWIINCKFKTNTIFFNKAFILRFKLSAILLNKLLRSINIKSSLLHYIVLSPQSKHWILFLRS